MLSPHSVYNILRIVENTGVEIKFRSASYYTSLLYTAAADRKNPYSRLMPYTMNSQPILQFYQPPTYCNLINSQHTRATVSAQKISGKPPTTATACYHHVTILCIVCHTMHTQASIAYTVQQRTSHSTLASIQRRNTRQHFAFQ